MACSRNHCPSCCTGCNNTYARINTSLWSNNWNNCSSGCGGSSCSNNCGNCSCNHCGNHCHHCSSCSCDSGSSIRNCGHGSHRCGSCSGYGVLRTIAGPYNSRCSRWTDSYPNFPFYTGPCGPCKCNNGCNSCGNCCTDPCCKDDCFDDPCCAEEDCCDPCCETTADCLCTSSAHFSAGTPVALAAGDCVRFCDCGGSTGDFSLTPEGVRIHRSGSYMVLYTVHVPANEAISSRFCLMLNGERIAASAMDVNAAAGCSSNGYTMHALVHAASGALLKLVSQNPVSMGASPASNVFSLTLSRLH